MLPSSWLKRVGRWIPRPQPRPGKPSHAVPKSNAYNSVGRIFDNKNMFSRDIARGILKRSFLLCKPYDVLETRLLALSTNIAGDSPKHRKGCKTKMRISGCLEPYRFFFLILQPLHGFGGVRQVTKTHFLSVPLVTIPDSGVQMTTVAHFYRAVLLPPYLVRAV